MAVIYRVTFTGDAGASVVYCGVDRDEARAAYDQTIAEWLANGKRLPVKSAELTVVELCAA